jgi:outer membrane protein assembly factor BamB
MSIDASQVIGGTAAGSPSVIYAGRGYATYSKPGVGNVAACFDIRTGEVFYEIPVAQGGTTPTVVSYSTSSMNINAELLSIGSRLLKVNPWSGEITTNVTGMSGVFHSNNYVLSVQNIGNASKPNYRLINWTTTGTSADFSSRVISNISWPMSSLGSVYDLNVDVAVNIISTAGTGGAYVDQTLNAYNIKTGESMWNATVEGGYYSGSCDVADNGKVAVLVDRGYFVAYDLLTGTKAWQSDMMDYPWDAPAFGAYDIGSAYGMIFRSAYSGVYAFDWDTGKIVWKFESPTPYAFETPYIDANGTSVYSFNGAMLIADGKVYTYNTEHSPSEPITRGWRLFAINATNGEGLWNITAYSGSRTFRGAAADGYLAFDNFYDAYMYVYGKGLSSTTVTAPTVQVPMGNTVLIQGSVLDQSPAQPGTPCVSEDSMSTQMEYLHMQQSIGGVWGNATIEGVPVILTAIDSTGQATTIGTVTTNGYYGTYSYAWNPPKADTYTITATFVGDNSYGSSSAATAVIVSVASAETSTTAPSEIVMPPYELYTIGTGIAVIIVVLIAMMLMRKKP